MREKQKPTSIWHIVVLSTMSGFFAARGLSGYVYRHQDFEWIGYWLMGLVGCTVTIILASKLSRFHAKPSGELE